MALGDSYGRFDTTGSSQPGQQLGVVSPVLFTPAYQYPAPYAIGDNTVELDRLLPLLSSRYQGIGEVVIVVGSGGSDVTSAVNAALATGADVVLSDGGTGTAGVARITGTLTLSAVGQRLSTRNVAISPAFVGDAVLITQVGQAVQVRLSGALQPDTGNAADYQEVAAIRIGGGSYNAKNSSIARSYIYDAWKGNGVIWEQGAHVDLASFSIYTSVTYDGIRCTSNYDDNNEGNFLNTRVSNCGRNGYWFQNNATPTLSSRHHRFNNAKAFGCATNFRFETNSCTGSIFSENGSGADQFTSTSFANRIAYVNTNTMYASVVDSGIGNEISGLNSAGVWDTRALRARALDVSNLFIGRQRFTQTADSAFSDTILDTNTNVTITHNTSGSGTRTDVFSGPVTANAGLSTANATLSAGQGFSLTGFLRFNSSNRNATASVPSNAGPYSFSDATAGAIVLTLPTTGLSNGTILSFTKIDASANTVTISGTINGGGSYVLSAQYQSVTLIYSGGGAGWYILSAH